MKRTCLPLFAALSVALPCVAQNPEPTPAAPAPASAGATLNDKKDLISVDFPNEEIRTILRNVAELFELNLVVPETLQGRTSIKLRNVTWRQIFKEILTPIKYTFIEDGNILRVVSIESQLQEPTKTKVFILNYSRANEILPTVAAMVDTSEAVKGRVQIDQRNNALVVTERPSRLAEIEPILAQLDVATAQVMIETKFVEVTVNDSRNIGVNWASLDGTFKAGLKEATVRAASPVNYRAETYPNAQTGGTPGLVTYDAVAVSSNLSNVLNTMVNSPQLVATTFTANEFAVIISALEAQDNVRLVSNPTLVTLNNVEATINIGEEYPIPNYQYNQERGSFEISGFTYKSIGINLKVTPQVNNAGIIKMNVLPEVSNRSGAVNFGGTSGATIPIVDTRKTATQISLKNGNTMGLGGLIQSQTSKGNSRVPVLGDIPVLGRIFKSKNNDITARNLIIFITAKTLDAKEPKVEDVFDADILRSLDIKRADLPGRRSTSALE